MSISLLNLSAPQVFPKVLHNSLSCQNWSIRFFKLDYSILYIDYVRPPHRIPEALARHVRPSSLSRVNQAYPAPYPGSRDLTRTCLAPSPNMSGLSVLSWVTATLSSFLAGFQRWWSDMSGPRPGHVWVFETPTARFPWGLQKVPHASLAGLV
jgi:hypothetical protein